MGYVCAHKLFSCFKWNNLFIHRVYFLFYYCFEKFIWKYWAGIGSVSGLLAGVASRSLSPILRAHLKHQHGFPPWTTHPGLLRSYPHFFMVRETKQACLYCFQKETKREDTAKAFKQDWFCVWIYPTMEIHISIFSYNYVLFRWKAQRGNFRRPVLELSECSQNQMSWSLSPRTMDTYTFTLHRWTIRSGWLGKITVSFHVHRFSQHRLCSTVVLATEKIRV